MQAVLRNWALSLFVVVVTAAGIPVATAADPFDGKWKMVSIEHAGMKLPDDLVTKIPSQIHFELGKVRVVVGDKVLMEGTYMFDETKTPKTFTMSGLKDRKGNEKKLQGIFEINDKGQLRTCVTTADSEKLPTSFDTKANPGSDLTTYEKVR
ncbi:TIGR03067 domain-containing protein [Anatilimnocola sp. NA78]|uniref:TIGR03067 domain-containing protein n=1 Tax=Anatilimnocola sp. NA78 TaxID=3415683 RepID=UPI003CE588EA